MKVNCYRSSLIFSTARDMAFKIIKLQMHWFLIVRTVWLNQTQIDHIVKSRLFLPASKLQFEIFMLFFKLSAR